MQVVFIYFQDKDVLFPQTLEMADIGTGRHRGAGSHHYA
jgi:hypothetical protein